MMPEYYDLFKLNLNLKPYRYRLAVLANVRITMFLWTQLITQTLKIQAHTV